MSSLVGHMLGGVAAAQAVSAEMEPRERLRVVLLAAVVSLLPDLDIVIYLLFNPLGMIPHRGASHSLLAAVVASVLLAMCCSRWLKTTELRLFVVFFAAYFSHLLFDFLMASGPAIRFLWPFKDNGYLCPIQVVPTAYYGLNTQALLGLLRAPAVYRGVLLELTIFVPLLLLPAAKTGSRRFLLLLLSATGVAVTMSLYN